MTHARRAAKAGAAGLAIAIASLAGCGSDPVDGGPRLSVEPGEAFTLRVGETVYVTGADLAVRLRAVMGDSRCPVGVTCVWAGDAVAAVEIDRSGDRLAYGLHVNPGPATGPGHADVGGYRIVLEGVAPEPLPGVPIPQAEYRAALRVAARP